MSLQRPGGLYLLSADTSLRQHVAAASSWLGRVYAPVESVEELLGIVATAQPCAVLIDRDDRRSLAALHEIAPRIAPTATTSIVVVRGRYDDVPRGADIVADASTIPDVLRAVGRPPAEPERALERLLGISVLGGPLDSALRRAEQEIAAALGATRGMIAIGASTDEAHERCRAALACAATVIAPTSDGFASYIGVTFDDRVDGLGCLGLVSARARVFSDVDRAQLEAVASRLGTELAWRGTHSRAADELDRLKHNAGIDALTGTWNRQAIARLTAMYLSTSMRFKQSLGVIAMDIVGLRALNTRRGLDVGDAVLEALADAARAQTRIEDIVGRLAPGMLVTILQGVSLDGTQRVATRIKQQLDTRLGTIAPGLAGDVQVRFGVCVAYPNEDAGALLDRAARSARESIAGAPKAPDLGDEVGTTLGGTYRLLHEIGQGAMGLVYRAEDLALERPVAIKMLRPDLVEDHEIVEQLRREASLLARLQHPNLVQVYSFAHGGGDAYIVMELVEGECLLHAIERHRLEGTTFTVGEVLAIASEVASALDALHEHGVVHRDVKPANVIRDPFRARSVLVDVGIARRFGQAVETAGTPGYVAPEVILGEEATPLSDVYGFASTVYSLLTLSSPWADEEKAAILTRQASGDAPLPLSKLRRELAAADDLFRSALHYEPAQRPASAGMLARSLATALAGHATPVVERGTERPSAIGRVILPRRTQIAQARTRGVVFRSVARAIGVRDAERIRDRLTVEEPELARALTDAAPDDWLPTALLTRLLALAPTLADRDGATLGRDVARATVRASFRRFFPASAATLAPERTLSAIRTIWGRYHSWGTVSCMPLNAGESVVRISDTAREADLCAFASGMFEQMVVLSGGHAPHVEHERCEARGDTVCLFRVTWERAV